MAVAPNPVTFTRKPIAFTCKRPAFVLSEACACEVLLAKDASENVTERFFAIGLEPFPISQQVPALKKRTKRFRILRTEDEMGYIKVAALAVYAVSWLAH
jgi:hypothetical protein